MSIRDIDNYDLFKRFFARSGGNTRTGFFDMDPFRAFEEMEEEMGRMFGQFQDIQTNAPKELIREYQTPDGAKVREVGPIVYGYSMTIGPDGKPKVREFGNVKSPGHMGLTTSTSAGSGGAKPSQQITAERELLDDVNTNAKKVKDVQELPCVKKKDIKESA